MANPGQEYLKMQVMSASPEMLTLMLWDGAIRFSEQGREAIQRKDIEGSYKALMRAQKIIMELLTSLRHEVDADLCGKLASLYNFIHRRLVQANMKKDEGALGEALKIMRIQRDTWAQLCEKVGKERAASAAAVKRGEDVEVEEPMDTEVPVEVVPSAPALALAAGASSTMGRRGYPAFAGRPAVAVGMSSLSIEG